MTFEDYVIVMAAHGRRVANRAALSATPLDQRKFTDFHDAYGPEDDLPEHERGTTPLLHTFDPTGRNVHYDGQNDDGESLWPEPGSDLAELAADDEAGDHP